MTAYHTLRWEGDASGTLSLIDQTLLPAEYVEIACSTVESVWEAIKVLRVRGAPAIGVAAAYGVVTGLQPVRYSERHDFDTRLIEVSREAHDEERVEKYRRQAAGIEAQNKADPAPPDPVNETRPNSLRVQRRTSAPA